jgi:transposase-like protein
LVFLGRHAGVANARVGVDRPGRTVKKFTKNVLETALNEALAEHLGHEKNQF